MRSKLLRLARVTALSLALVLGLTACRRAATQLVVVVDTDLASSEIASVHVVAHALDAPAGHPDGTWDFVPDRYPFSFGVAAPGRSLGQRVELRVEALDVHGAVLVSRRVRTGFVPEQALRLPIFLADACRGHACAPELDCDRGVCVTPDVPTTSLDPVDPGTELDDAGARDAGVQGCVPVSLTTWWSLPSAPLASALVTRELPTGSFEWMLGASSGAVTELHTVGADGVGDRDRGRLDEAWQDLALWPVASPGLALLVGSSTAPMLRRAQASEDRGLGAVDDLVAARLAGHAAFTSLGDEPIVIAGLTADAAVYGIPSSGPPRLVTTYNLGTLAASDLAATIPLAAHGVLAGHATELTVSLRRITPAGDLLPTNAYTPSSACGPEGCSPPGLAELPDGRIVVAISTRGGVDDVWVWLLSADTREMIATRLVGTGEAPFVVAGLDGRVWVGFVTGTRVVLHVLAADATLADLDTIRTLDITGSDASQVRVAHRGRAIGIAHTRLSAPFDVSLDVVCQ